ncbi:MAG: DUF5131 family protein [Pseudomonadota bacterium]
MIDISKGRYWDLPLSWVDGCTPCSPGCEHCWTLAMEKRFRFKDSRHWDGSRVHDMSIQTHPERLSIPLKRRKPTVYAIWNDFWHESVPDDFQYKAIEVMAGCNQHTFLVLTKRPNIATKYFEDNKSEYWDAPYPNIFWGLTICNQQEADEKIPIFLRVPGKKFLSIEPMLGKIDISEYINLHWKPTAGIDLDSPQFEPRANAVILGGETSGNRPGREMKIEWAENVADQCEAARVPLFVKQLYIGGKVSKDITEWPLKLQRRELPWKETP